MQLHLFARYRSSSRGAEAARSSELASDPSCGPGLLRWVLFGDTLYFYPCRLWCQEVHFYNGLRKKLVAKALGGALGGRGDDEAELWGASFAPCSRLLGEGCISRAATLACAPLSHSAETTLEAAKQNQDTRALCSYGGSASLWADGGTHQLNLRAGFSSSNRHRDRHCSNSSPHLKALREQHMQPHVP